MDVEQIMLLTGEWSKFPSNDSCWYQTTTVIGCLNSMYVMQ